MRAEGTRVVACPCLVLAASRCHPPPRETCSYLVCEAGETAVLTGDGGCVCRSASDGGPDAGCDRDGHCDESCDWDAYCIEGCPPEGLPHGGECDPFEQACCPAGQKCTATRTGLGPREICVDYDVAGQHGDPCWIAGEAECGPGTACVGLGYIDTRVAFCWTTDDCPAPEGFTCQPLTNRATEYSVCIQAEASCDPVSQTGCPGDRVCVVNAAERAALTNCLARGEHGVGEFCGDGRGCQAGLACYTPPEGDPDLCYAYCDLEADGCLEGTCEDVVFHSTYGLCL